MPALTLNVNNFFNIEANATNSGDKRYKLMHFYINLTFRMLVNIHFQK